MSSQGTLDVAGRNAIDDDDDNNAYETANNNYPSYDRDEGMSGKNAFCIGDKMRLYLLLYPCTLYAFVFYVTPTELFAKFLQEHTMLVSANNSDSDEEDDLDDPAMMIPTALGANPMRRVPCYPPHLQRIRDRLYYTTNTSATAANRTSSSESSNVFILEVPLSELVEWNAIQGGDLVDRVTRNTVRYHALFCQVVDTLISHLTASTTTTSTTPRDVIDILHEQRLLQQQHQQQNNSNNLNHAVANNSNNPYAGTGNMDQDAEATPPNGNNNNATQEFPPVLMRRYELRILPVGRRGVFPPFVHQQHPSLASAVVKKPTAVSLRQVRARSLGQLVTISGMVVRASDVKPSVTVATYSCDACGAEVYQVLQPNQREFLPVTSCPACSTGSSGDTLHLQTRGSKFVKYQELKLQELPHQVPMGHVPRSLPVLCRGELTRQATPGDIVTVDGIFLPQRLAETGFKAMKAGLVATTFVQAQNVAVHKKSYDETAVAATDNETETAVWSVAQGPDPVGRLARSIAPEIFGHGDIKRSLLLQLVGGCTRVLPDGMRIRGDINVCLMGDPGVAKSQLLKHVASIAPRGVYTTGKGSSGVGLTAAVTKDATTGEMALEGGALVLADKGICCIDEFDKMDESDRTAIHEVMEQQTVSIAKAGIVATLNARSSVLAAANPLYGRYNRRKSLSENINLPNSLLSRFDLLFLILDVADVDKDMALARHVTLVHQNEGLAAVAQQKGKKDNTDAADQDSTDKNNTNDNDKSDLVSAVVLREYIARARQHHPVMPPNVAPYVVEAYVSLRMQNSGGSSNRHSKASSDQTVMTARQLLSILRLSQALARLRFSDSVAREDVDEAIRLTHMSKSSLLDDDSESSKRGEDVLSRIFHILRDYSAISGHKEVELKLCEAMVLRKGFTVQQLQSCLEEYEALQVIQVNRTRTHVYFIDEL